MKVHGPPKQLDGRDDFPFVVVSPQCPEDQRWQADALAALLDDVTKRLRIDPDRVYVTGLSMGGRGTWDLAMSYPERFAIASVCGGALPDRACRLKDVPVRAFHGAKDPVVPLAESETVVDAVRMRRNGRARRIPGRRARLLDRHLRRPVPLGPAPLPSPPSPSVIHDSVPGTNGGVIVY